MNNPKQILDWPTVTFALILIGEAIYFTLSLIELAIGGCG